MKKECNGIKYRSPDGSVEVDKLTDMFVDDLNQYCNNPPPGHTPLIKASFFTLIFISMMTVFHISSPKTTFPHN